MTGSSTRRLCLAVVVWCGFLPLAAEQLRNHFDFDAPLREPGFFDFIVLGSPAEAQWKVVADVDPPSPPNQLTQTFDGRPSDSIAVAVRRNVLFQDGTWSVAMKKGGGRGGVVFRMADEKNYLFLWIDSTTGDARLSACRGGKTSELARAHADWRDRWGILTISASGSAISAEWGGHPLLKASDPYPAAGRTGLGTAGPGLASFDEFILEPAGPESGRR